MKTKSLFIALRLLTVTIFFLAVSCASAPMRGYKGPDLSSDKTAIIENGVYLDIDKCDGVNLGSFQNKVIVEPGDHTIETAFRTQYMGDIAVYSRQTAYITFKAEAGHTYVAYAHTVSNHTWTTYIKDKKTDEEIAHSDSFPLFEEWICMNCF